MSVLRIILLAVLAVWAPTSPAQSIDPDFGNHGHRTHAFELFNGYDEDHAVVGCAGPGGTLVVAGIASNTERVVVIRIRHDGTLDPAFSSDGKESFPIPIRPLYAHTAVGVCQSDGKPVIGFPAYADNEENLQLLRINPQNGLPDQTFGVAGYATIDLDQYASGLGNRETPMGISVHSTGVIDVTGQALMAGNSLRAGFVARVSPAGVALAAMAGILPGFQDTVFTAAGLASDGQLWVAGHGFRNGSNVYLRAVMDAQTLAVTSVPVIGSPVVNTGRGRFVAPDVMVSLARRNGTAANGSPTVQAVLLIHRPAGTTALIFNPLAPFESDTTAVHSKVADGDVIPLPDGRVLISGSVQVPAIGDVTRGLYFGAAYLATNQQPDRIDSAFGNGGIWQTRFIDHAAGCSQAMDQAHRRTTLWNGRVTIVGQARSGSCTASASIDYWISRLRVEVLFGSGFE